MKELIIINRKRQHRFLRIVQILEEGEKVPRDDLPARLS